LSLRELRLKEHGVLRGVELTAEEVRFLTASAARLSVLATGESGRFDIEASDIVGTLVGPTLRVVIEPKVAVPLLLHLLGSSELPPLAPPASFSEYAGLTEPLVDFYTELLMRALKAGGPVVGYREVRDDLQSPRGRIDWLAIEARQFGLLPPVPCEFHELDLDTELNRRLVAAGHLLLRASERPGHRLRAALQKFIGVADVAYPARVLPRIHFDRRTERFRPALALAEAILRRASFSLAPGTTYAPTFLLDMSKVFEDYVIRALQRRLERRTKSFKPWPGGLALDQAVAFRITPDAIAAGSSGSVVIDAKYKATGSGRIADLYQLISYCVALRAKRAVAVYADAEDRTHAIRNSDIEVMVFGLDLDCAPSELEFRMDRVARHVQTICGGGDTAGSRSSLVEQP
jgi:5-methylcytosine-specific restriction enzyme subunit McrC